MLQNNCMARHFLHNHPCYLNLDVRTWISRLSRLQRPHRGSREISQVSLQQLLTTREYSWVPRRYAFTCLDKGQRKRNCSENEKFECWRIAKVKVGGVQETHRLQTTDDFVLPVFDSTVFRHIHHAVFQCDFSAGDLRCCFQRTFLKMRIFRISARVVLIRLLPQYFSVLFALWCRVLTLFFWNASSDASWWCYRHFVWLFACLFPVPVQFG